MNFRLPGRLLVVTDRHQSPIPLPHRVDELLDGGVRWFWLRDRDLPAAARHVLAEDLARRIARRGGTLTIGADVDLAAACGAGVQLGTGADIAAARRMLAAGAPIGVSAHSLADLRHAHRDGADYATLSPIFVSASKPGYGPPLGPASLRAAAALPYPVLALGGVTALEVPACLSAGASGVVVMGPAMRVGQAAVAPILAMLPPDLGP